MTKIEIALLTLEIFYLSKTVPQVRNTEAGINPFPNFNNISNLNSFGGPYGK